MKKNVAPCPASPSAHTRPRAAARRVLLRKTEARTCEFIHSVQPLETFNSLSVGHLEAHLLSSIMMMGQISLSPKVGIVTMFEDPRYMREPMERYSYKILKAKASASISPCRPATCLILRR